MSGASIPRKANDAFPPYFRFPPSSQNISESETIFPTFSQKFMFHPPKFLMTFFVIDSNFFNFPPIFTKTQHFGPLFWKIYYFPHISEYFSLISWNLRAFAYFTCFSLPP